MAFWVSFAPELATFAMTALVAGLNTWEGVGDKTSLQCRSEEVTKMKYNFELSILHSDVQCLRRMQVVEYFVALLTILQ